jgi:hypothetical protein
MEGNYAAVWAARAEVPDPAFGPLTQLLMAAVRAEAAECVARGYDRIGVEAAQQTLFFEGPCVKSLFGGLALDARGFGVGCSGLWLGTLGVFGGFVELGCAGFFLMFPVLASLFFLSCCCVILRRCCSFFAF